MNDALKQRLVGAGVLLILTGLLWPILFDFDQPVLEIAPPSQIPPRNLIEPVAVAAAEKRQHESERKNESAAVGKQNKASLGAQTETRETAKNNSNTESNSDDDSEDLAALIADIPAPAAPAGKNKYQARVAEQDRPRLDADGIPVSLVVQVGTFSKWENADKLRDRLIVEAFKAYTKPTTSTTAGPYQVFVGPVLTYAQAQRVVGDVKAQFKLNDAIIKRFRNQQ